MEHSLLTERDLKQEKETMVSYFLIEAAHWGRTDVVVEFVKGGANSDLQNKVCIVMNTGYPAIVIVVPMSHHNYSFTAHSRYSQGIQDGWLACPSPNLLVKSTIC